MKPGIYTTVPAEEYHADTALNFSALKMMDKSALHYRTARIEQRKDTPAFAFGRAAHCAVLEPDTWDARYMLWPAEVEVTRTKELKSGPVTTTAREPLKVRNGAAWDAAVALAEGREILTEEKWETAKSVAASVHADKCARELIKRVDHREVTVVTSIRGVPVRARIDLTGSGLISELKSTANIVPDKFFRDVIKYNYLAQLAWYADLWRLVTGEKPEVKIVAIEKERPYDCMVVRFSESDIKQGRDLYNAWLDRAIECDARQSWPGVADGCEVAFRDPYEEVEIAC